MFDPERTPEEQEAIREHHDDEVRSGLERIGPQYEDEGDDSDVSAVRAAGMGCAGMMGEFA
jgi:hypothetical protein